MSALLGHLSSENPLNYFELLGPLGQGSYGEVVKARLVSTAELVAVKLISVEPNDSAMMSSVHKEIDILQSCTHDNIVRYRGSFLSEETLWIVMEYCGAGSVRDLYACSSTTLPEAAIAIICRETLKGLQYLHLIDKIHRDIKASNILLNEKGQVKLADFGVSAQLDGTLAKRNTFIGTPYWMAPEVIQESYYDGKADIWSLGITALEIAEKRPPHSDIHPMRVLFKILRDPPPTLKNENNAWSADFTDFVSCCCVKEPLLRASAEHLLTHPFIVGAGSCQLLSEVIESCSFQIGIERDISQESHFDAMIHGQQMNYATATYSTSGSIYETVRIRYSVQDQPPAGLMEMVQAQQQTGTLKQSETLKRSSSILQSPFDVEQKAAESFGTLSGRENEVKMALDEENIAQWMEYAMQRFELPQLPWITGKHLSTEAMTDKDRQQYNLSGIYQDMVKACSSKMSSGREITVAPVIANAMQSYSHLRHKWQLSTKSSNDFEELTERKLDLETWIKAIFKL